MQIPPLRCGMTNVMGITMRAGTTSNRYIPDFNFGYHVTWNAPVVLDCWPAFQIGAFQRSSWNHAFSSTLRVSRLIASTRKMFCVVPPAGKSLPFFLRRYCAVMLSLPER